MEQYRETIEKTLARVESSAGGLSSAEAELRLQKNGRNSLKEGKKKSKIMLFFAQFKDLMTLILIAAAALSGVLAFVTGDRSELADTAILLAVILLNAVVGFLQQYRADAAIANLKKLSKCEAKVIRDGKVVKIDAEELVVGDVVELEEGDRVPADCRILSSENFRCDESALTGESVPVKKYDCVVEKTALSERRNTAFLSSFCVKGTARCVAVGCGMDTEMGRIATLLHENRPDPSPLDKTIAKLGKIITVSVLLVALVLFAGGMLARRLTLLQNIMAAIAVAVAAIPEGMGAVVTVILAMGVQRMAKSRAVMRKLSAVEALGSCSVICSDKTGTLTKNRMTVESVSVGFAGTGGENCMRELLRCIRVCHSVKGSAGSYLGDPTEIALLEYADGRDSAFSFRAVGGTPFSSERKMMSVLCTFGGETRLYVKGGADVLLKRCTKVLTAKGEAPMSEVYRSEIEKKSSEYAAKAMRVLGFAYGDGAQEEDLTFIGLAAMLDPPKEGAKEAVAACARAGIKTVMITGDSPQTAFAIATRLGIASNVSEVVTGEELDKMGEEEFTRNVKRYSVYARVSPGHKSEIVRALKAGGEVVAMTGDGVNDAPALKAADIGVAMGSGTDVTKNAADVVLADDDFSTMVRAVEEGRSVFFNIKKTISFFLATNLAEVLSVLIVSLFLWRYDFLTSTQLLWVNLITDSLPVLALGVEKTEGAMLRPPVSDREIFSRRSLCRILFFGLAQTVILVTMFVCANRVWGNGVASTMAFVALSGLELFHGFNVRREDMLSRPKSPNCILLLTVGVGVLLSVLLVVIPPVRVLFGLTALDLTQWAISLGLSAAIVPVGLLYRMGERLCGRVRRHERRIPLRERP